MTKRRRNIRGGAKQCFQLIASLRTISMFYTRCSDHYDIFVMHDILNEYKVSKKNKCVLYEEIVVVAAASYDVVFVVAAGWCVRKSTCENSLR